MTIFPTKKEKKQFYLGWVVSNNDTAKSNVMPKSPLLANKDNNTNRQYELGLDKFIHVM